MGVTPRDAGAPQGEVDPALAYSGASMRLGLLSSHPIQYHAPLFRELALRCDLTVYFAHRQSPQDQAAAGFGVPFEWDIDLLSGYRHRFLHNNAKYPATDKFFGCNTPEIKQEIDDGRFDAFIVTGWGLLCYWQAVWACRRAHVPVLIRGDSQLLTPRNPVLRWLKWLIYPLLLRSFDGFLYVGRRNREYLLYYGVSPLRLFFSPHCIDNRSFAAGAAMARHERPTAPVLQARTPRVLFSGKLMELKRPFDVIDALALVRAGGGDVHGAFVGAGELEQEIRNRAAANGVPVEFHGFRNQSELPAIYATADLLVLPSEQETWGLVVNEAMACGIPAVVSDAVGCAPDLIEPGTTGATYPVGNVHALANAIQSVLRLDEGTVCRQLAAKMEIYSPIQAAEGIIHGARTTLLSRRPR